MKHKTTFNLVGLSRPQSTTCKTKDGKHLFNSPIAMEKYRFDALFNYVKTGEWSGKETATIEHDGLDNEGIPINPLVIDIDI